MFGHCNIFPQHWQWQQLSGFSCKWDDNNVLEFVHEGLNSKHWSTIWPWGTHWAQKWWHSRKARELKSKQWMFSKHKLWKISKSWRQTGQCERGGKKTKNPTNSPESLSLKHKQAVMDHDHQHQSPINIHSWPLCLVADGSFFCVTETLMVLIHTQKSFKI